MKKRINQKLRRIEIRILNSPTFNVFIAIGMPIGLLTILGELL
mgnify:FL=1|jgi:hypothetical protein|tara:strand:- start:406 stop:534 length:129 start_codon:yes stop_codon:yes gene_type:complete